MEERAQRIVDAAIELAEEGGFQNVRLRDVAEKSGVAFGTLYARFNSKEDILVAALEQEINRFCDLMADVPIPGDTAELRLKHFFTSLTQVLVSRRGFAMAVLRSVSSGIPGVSDKVMSYQSTMNRLIASAVEGQPVNDMEPTRDNTDLFYIARLMQNIWYAELIGWISDAVTDQEVISRTVRGCYLLLSGYEARGLPPAIGPGDGIPSPT